MKRSAVLALSFPVFLAACGGGSPEVPNITITAPPEVTVPDSDDPVVVDPPIGEQPPSVITDPPVTDEPPVIDLPEDIVESTTGSTGSDPGALASLYGALGFGYGFDGEQATFSFGVQFSAASVAVTDSGAPFLAATTQISTALTQDAEPIVGELTTVGCLYTSALDQFLCLLDVGGANQSVFSFGRVDEESLIVGDFEFCGSENLEDCTLELFTAPDGPVVVFFIPESGSSNRSRSKEPVATTDLTPYFQYFEQGSNTSSKPQSYPIEQIETLTAAAKNR